MMSTLTTIQRRAACNALLEFLPSLFNNMDFFREVRNVLGIQKSFDAARFRGYRVERHISSNLR